MSLVHSPENPGMTLINLLPEAAPDSEIFNIDEDGEVQQGQLRRYLKIMGPVLDDMKGLVDAFPTMIDVDHTDSDFLPFMAELVGVKFNREIPIPQAREEIKGAVQWYKRKGTVVGSRIHGYKISRLQTDIVEFVYNIRTSNREYSFSADKEGAAALAYQLPGDPTAFSYDYSYKNILGIGSVGGEGLASRIRALFLIANEQSHGSPPIEKPSGGYYTSLIVSADVSKQVIASVYLEGHEPWRVSDGQEATCWVGDELPAYLFFSFSDPTLPILMRIKAGMGLQTFAVSWSDDFINWTEISEHVYGDIQEFTQGLGDASGVEETKAVMRNPVTSTPDVRVFEVSSYSGVSLVLMKNVAFGESILQVDNTGGLSEGDWIELSSYGRNNGYYQIDSIEGNLLILTVPISEAVTWPVFTDINKVTVIEKEVMTDFFVDYWTGFITLLDGKFTAGNNVFALYFGLVDKKSLEVWQEFPIESMFLTAHLHWRIEVKSTWHGDASICGLEIIDDQFWGTYYRCERLGYFFTLGNGRPGCGGQIICNKPLLAETVQKLCRTMREAVPVGRVPVMVAVDCKYPEVVELGNLGFDPAKTDITSRNREQTNFGSGGQEKATDSWFDIITDRTLYSNDNDMGSPPKVNVDGEYYVSPYATP